MITFLAACLVLGVSIGFLNSGIMYKLYVQEERKRLITETHIQKVAQTTNPVIKEYQAYSWMEQ